MPELQYQMIMDRVKLLPISLLQGIKICYFSYNFQLGYKFCISTRLFPCLARQVVSASPMRDRLRWNPN